MKTINQIGKETVRSFVLNNCKHQLDAEHIAAWIDIADTYGRIEIDGVDSVSGNPTPLWLDDDCFDEVSE